MASAINTTALKRGAFVLLIACATIVSPAASTPALSAKAATGPGEAVPGEILVRFAPNVATEARAKARRYAGVTVKRNLLLPRLQLVRTLPGTPVSAALDALNADPGVLYAEPNGLYRLHSAPNDPRFGEQWNLHNTGQTIQLVEGVPGADISAPEAWDIATGSRAVRVAVIDSGVDYFHPDLAANMWRNPGEAVAGEGRNGLDDDNNGFVDDLYGWDFIDNDADPLDSTFPYGHGTSVAGIAGAVSDNGFGIAGINRNVSLVALKACDHKGCPFDAIADATTYAGRIGADVANMSFGGAGTQPERDAIAAASDTLFVAAAGNDGTNNDTNLTSNYPCSYDLANVVCVTATDNRDGQAYNYGASSVDLGAPGVNLPVARIMYRELFSDDFDGVAPLWDYTQVPAPAVAGKWRRTLWTHSVGYYNLGLEDSELGGYANNADTRVTLNSPVDLSGQHGCFLSFEAALATELSKDYLRVEAATSPAGPYSELTRMSGSTLGAFAPVFASLARFDGAGVYLRLRLTSDGANTADGAHIDNFKVRCEDPVSSYSFGSGTSFAAPQVAGAAALVKSHMPGLSVAGLREQILSSVDPLPSLAGKTVTGGRLNVARALATLDTTAPDTLIDSGPADGGIANATAVSFAFGSTEPGSTFECKVDAGEFAACTSTLQLAPLTDGPHSFQVKATDLAGNEDLSPASRSFTVDTTPPETTIDSGPVEGATITDSSPTFAFSTEPGASLECRLDSTQDADFQTCTSPKQLGPLADGSHTFEVRATDGVGNTNPTSASRTFTVDTSAPVDTTPPETTITEGPVEGATIASASTSFAFSASEPAIFECRLDLTSFDLCDSPDQLELLTDGPHSFQVKATDLAGNEDLSPASRSFTVSTPPPPPAAKKPTGKRAAALKKCKKKKGAARKTCIKKANKLPV